MNIDKKKINEFLKRVEKIKTSGGVDLSAAEDLSIAVMNLISLEEHFFFTGAKKGEEFFAEAYRLYAIFWALKTKLVSTHSVSGAAKQAAGKGWSLETLVEKLARSEERRVGKEC